MKNSNFNQLVDYCYNDLSPEQRKAVDLQIIKSDATISAVNGINALKRKFGKRQAVEQFIDRKVEESFSRLFPLDRS